MVLFSQGRLHAENASQPTGPGLSGFREKNLQGSDINDYVELLKPRVMSLAVFTAVIGMLLVPTLPHPVLALFSVIAIGAGAGAAGAINMWYDRDIDALMERTKFRPLPSKRVNPSEALTLGIVLSIFSILILSF